MATLPTPKTDSAFIEAPASWNTRYITPTGFVCQITLRADSGKDLLERANAALGWLVDNNFMPCENTYKPKFDGKKSDSGSNQKANVGNNGQASATCGIHQCELRRFEKNGRVWYSHKTDDGGWCNGKSK